MIIRTHFVLPALCALAAGAASAQTQTPSPAAGASQAPIDQRSVFSGYRPYRDGPIADWRESNDRVGELKGHAGHVGVPPGEPDAKSDRSQSSSDAGASEAQQGGRP